MSKDAYWFKHDTNASRDLKMMEIRAIYGYEGIGLFWSIMEVFREQSNYSYQSDKINILASILAIDELILTKFITDCKRIGLIKISGKNIYSSRLSDDMKVWESKSKNRKKPKNDDKEYTDKYKVDKDKEYNPLELDKWFIQAITWQEQTCPYKTSLKKYREYQESFIALQKRADKKWGNLKEGLSHFSNWLEIQLKNNNKQTSSTKDDWGSNFKTVNSTPEK